MNINTTIKIGDILVSKTGLERKVLGVLGISGEEIWANGGIHSKEWFIENGFTLKQAPWEPEVGQSYLYITSTGEIGYCHWDNDDVDIARKNLLGVFQGSRQGSEQAEAKIKLVRGLK